MTAEEWERIVLRLNASWPGQQLEPPTAVEWFTELADYPADRVWRAVRRCRREQRFRPSLADLFDAMAQAAQERATKRSKLAAIEARDPDSPGVPPPADFQAARARFLARTRLPKDNRPSMPPLESNGQPSPYGQWGQERVDAVKKPEPAS